MTNFVEVTALRSPTFLSATSLALGSKVHELINVSVSQSSTWPACLLLAAQTNQSKLEVETQNKNRERETARWAQKETGS